MNLVYKYIPVIYLIKYTCPASYLVFRADEYTWLGASDDVRGIQKKIGMEGRIFLILQGRPRRDTSQT